MKTDALTAKIVASETGSSLKLAVWFGGGLLLYGLSLWLAFATRVQPENIAVFWPPAGVMLALLVAVPRRMFWSVVLGLAFVTLICNHFAGRDVSLNVLLTCNDVFIGVMGVVLYKKWIGNASPVSGTRPYGRFLVIVALSAVLSATLGSLIMPYQFGNATLDFWLHWIGAMVLGLFVSTPLLVYAHERKTVLSSFKFDVELAVVLFLGGVWLFVLQSDTVLSQPLRIAADIAVIPLLLWVGVRRTALEASSFLVIATTMKILTLALDAGPMSLKSWPVPEGVLWIMAVFSVQCGAVLMLVANHSEQGALQRDKAEQAARMRSIIDAATDGIISADHTGKIETFSRSAVRLFGYQADEVIGKNVKMLMPNPYRDQHDGYLQHYADTNEKRIIGIGRLVTGLRKDGTEFPMELSVGEAMNGNQRVFTGFIRDVTELKKTEQRMHDLQDELLHVSRLSAMGELSSALAHELNQPLTAIKNYAQAAGIMLKKDMGKEELPGILAKTVEQAGRAGDIIKRLRGFVTTRHVERSDHTINQLIDEACALALIGAREDGVKAKIVHGNNIPSLKVDRIQIQQVLINLVRNAFDAVREGPVREVSVVSETKADSVLICVSDTGPGLAAEAEASLFKPFITTKPGGMGIGLSLSRGIAEAHGGTLTYKRNAGGGADFLLTLPIETDDKTSS